MMRIEGVAVDNAAEAETLMFYHLRLAAQLFEATDNHLTIPRDEFSSPAIKVWVQAMDALYPDSDQ